MDGWIEVDSYLSGALGAATWEIKDHECKAMGSALIPEGAPPSTHFGPHTAPPEVLQWVHHYVFGIWVSSGHCF